MEREPFYNREYIVIYGTFFVLLNETLKIPGKYFSLELNMIKYQSS